MQRFSLALFLTLFSLSASAEVVRVAVAANFYPVMSRLVEAFEMVNGDYHVELVTGSSGKLAAQVIQGAPFDLFLSADADRPRQLEEQGIAIQASRQTYARGQLVALLRHLPQSYRQIEQPGAEPFDVDRIAIANPDLAPYGRAAKQALELIGVQYDRKKMVYGENVSQVFHFFETGNVDLAFVARSLVMEKAKQAGNESREKPCLVINEEYYDPIEQQMVLLNDKPGAVKLHQYMLSDEAQTLIGQSGYDSLYSSGLDEDNY